MRYLYTLRWPIAVSALIYVVGHLLYGRVNTADLVLYAMMAQIYVLGWSGRLVVERRLTGLFGAALTGAFVVLVVHVTFKGGYFLALHLWRPDLLDGQGLRNVAGVLAAFSVFAPLCMVAGYVGGVRGRRLARRYG
jgi:hypothetical protein